MTASILQVISRIFLLDPILNPVLYTSSRINPLCPWVPIREMNIYSSLSNSTLLQRATPIRQLSDIQSYVNFCFNRLPLSNVHVRKIFKCHFHCAGAAARQKTCTQRRLPCPPSSTADKNHQVYLP